MKYFSIILMIGLLLACNLSKQDSNSSVANGNSATVKPDEAPKTHEIEPTRTPSDASLDTLRASVGKTADDIQLWDNKELATRLEKLLGPDFAVMKKYWQTQTPIEAEGDVLSLGGCEAHNCGNNQYLMYIDTANNNINVFHFKNGKMKAYMEKGEIALPSGFAKYFDELKENTETTK